MAFENIYKNLKGVLGHVFKAGRIDQDVVEIRLDSGHTGKAFKITADGADVFSISADGDIVGDALSVEAGTIGTAELADDAVTTAKLEEKTIQYAEVAISKAEILTLNTVGKELVAAPGAGKVIEFISMLLIHDFDTAAYTGGGTINVLHDATVVSNVIAAASAFGSGADSMAYCVSLDTANGIVLVANKPLNLKCNTGDFTDPGTAAGVGRAKVAYRVHTTGL